MRSPIGKGEDAAKASPDDKARDQLNAIFSNDRWLHAQPSRQDHLRIVNILKEFPRLTSVRFQVRYPGDNRMSRVSPLRLLVEGQAELEIIQTVYELNPGILSRDFDFISLLRRACEYRAPTAVVEFLSLKFPKNLTDSCYQQMALLFALQDTPRRPKSSLETIHLLLQLCPKSVRYVNKHEDTALNLAIKNGYDIAVIEKILNAMEQQAFEIAVFCIPKRWEFTLDAEAAKSINLILSRCAKTSSPKPFQCSPTNWTRDGFSNTMVCIANHKSALSSIKLDLPNMASNVPMDVVRDGLRHLCIGGSEIMELELVASQMPPGLFDQVLCGLNPPETGRKLRKLVLKGVNGLGLKSLVAFLASESAPIVVSVVSCRLHDNTDTGGSSSCCSSSPMERFDFKDSWLSFHGISQLLNCLSTMPMLKELYLIAPSEFSDEGSALSDLELPVEPLVALMDNNIIHTLGITGYTLEAEELLYESFVFNTSLRKYRFTNKKGYAPDRLEKLFRRHKSLLASAMEHNVTLVDPYVGHSIGMPIENNSLGATRQRPSSASAFSKIDYYKSLNKFGRKTARDPLESVEVVVKLLADVNVPFACFPCLDPLQKHSLQYGLLRESLSVWSGDKI